MRYSGILISGARMAFPAVLLFSMASAIFAADAPTSATKASAPKPEAKMQDNTQTSSLPAGLAEGTYAQFDTSQGTFYVKLFTDKTPKTAQNFIDLTEGNREFNDPETGKMVKRRLYDGRKIFRVIKGFMFQTGSANDSASYDAGYTMQDEILPDLAFDKPGLIAMANRGRNTASCQFFITLGTPSYLTGNYTIFGEVAQGMDVVTKIGNVPTRVNPSNPRDGESLPLEMPVINKVTIIKTAKGGAGK